MDDGRAAEHRAAKVDPALGQSILVPVYNEERHLRPMAEALIHGWT
jgi:hypothetical protein